MKSADLHVHTLYSDGTFTPAQLIEEAKSAGLACVSVVDHDTVEGLDPILAIAEKEGIEVLPGIELTAENDGSEVHILGYLIDYKSKSLREKLEHLKNVRVDRVHKIVEKLGKLGVRLDPEIVFLSRDEIPYCASSCVGCSPGYYQETRAVGAGFNTEPTLFTGIILPVKHDFTG